MWRQFLFGPAPPYVADFSFFFLRASAGLMLAFGHGLGKIPPSEKFVAGVEEMGFPLPLFFAWMAALGEFLGGILLSLGLFTRPAAFFMSFTMFVAVTGRHWQDPFGKKEMALLYLGISLFFLFLGSGRWSFDRMFWERKVRR